MIALRALEKRCLQYLLLALLLSLAVAPAALAVEQEGGIKAKVDSYRTSGENGFQAEVDQIAYRLVQLIRGIAGIAAVVFLVWVGLTFFGAGANPQALAQAKNQIVYFLIAVVLVMSAERIVGLLFSILGWEVPGA